MAYTGGAAPKGAPKTPSTSPHPGKPAPRTFPSGIKAHGIPDLAPGPRSGLSKLGVTYRGGGGHGTGTGGNDAGGGKGGGGGGGGNRGPRPNFNNPLYQPGTALSGKSLYRAGQALAESEYGPTIHTDRATMRENARQGAAAEKLTAGYFQQLGRFTHQSMAAEKGIAGQLQGQLAGIGGQTQAGLGQIGQQALQTTNRYAPGDPSLAAPGLQALTAQLAEQRGLAKENAQTFRSGGAEQGANYRQLSASNLGTFALGGQQELGNIAASTRLANQPVVNQIAGLLAKRGALAAADTAKLRQAEITNQLTRQGLGLKSKALQVTAAYDQGRLGLAKLDAQIRANEYAAQNKLGWATLSERQRNDLATQANRAADRNARIAAQHGVGGVKPLSTNENNTQLTLLGSAVAALHQYLGQPIKKGSKQKWTLPTLTRKLEDGQVPGVSRINSAVMQAAAELHQYGEINPSTLAALHKLGMHDITYNGKPIKVAHLGKNFGSHLF